MFRFTIRDVLWLTVVAALAAGWWSDQDRIRRQEANLRLEAQRLRALPVRRAEAVLKIAEAELDAVEEVAQRNRSAVSESEMRLLEARVSAAKLNIERAREPNRETISSIELD